jgi:hypothetical protein
MASRREQGNRGMDENVNQNLVGKWPKNPYHGSMKAPKVLNGVLIALCVLAVLAAGSWISRWMEESRVLKQIVERLSADSRAAQVLVTKSELNEKSGKILTTIKFLEYDAQGKTLPAKYFTFQGNVIQFQSLVIRFEDKFVRRADKLRGKSAYFFMKAFVLDGAKTQEFEITKTQEIPAGYKVPNIRSEFETELWRDFWKYALDLKARERAGIKNAQLEAPGSMFLPGSIYTLHIEHDGGFRIDAQPIPDILKGETVTT